MTPYKPSWLLIDFELKYKFHISGCNAIQHAADALSPGSPLFIYGILCNHVLRTYPCYPFKLAKLPRLLLIQYNVTYCLSELKTKLQNIRTHFQCILRCFSSLFKCTQCASVQYPQWKQFGTFPAYGNSHMHTYLQTFTSVFVPDGMHIKISGCNPNPQLSISSIFSRKPET